MFGGMILSSIVPQAAYVLPVSLDKIALALALGTALLAVGGPQLAATAVWCVIFSLAALLKFGCEEF